MRIRRSVRQPRRCVTGATFSEIHRTGCTGRSWLVRAARRSPIRRPAPTSPRDPAGAPTWPYLAGPATATSRCSTQLGALDALTLRLVAGSGGMPGDYLYGDHREPCRQAGLWGLLRVYGPGAGSPRLMVLP